MECYRHSFSCLQKLITKQTKLVQKSEKKLNVVLGGYVARQKNLVSRLNELHRDIDMSRINYLCFSKLAAQEQKSWRAVGCSCVVLAARLKDTKERLKREKERHTLLQKKYKELLVQIRNCSGVCFSYELGVSFFHHRVLFASKASLKFHAIRSGCRCLYLGVR